VSLPLIAIERTGLVTSVGYSAVASCAAMRAKLTNPSETRFVNINGDWILAHQVAFQKSSRGLTKLAQMAAMAISECLTDMSKDMRSAIPLLLCTAEKERPGRLENFDNLLFQNIQQLMQTEFSSESSIIAQGRVSIGTALIQARRLIAVGKVSHVLVAATDSLLTWPVVNAYAQEDRLLNPRNSNGLMLGEASGALLICAPNDTPALHLKGIGFGVEKSHIGTETPLRADGLTNAIRGALAEGGLDLVDVDYRITDLSGEHYYFKEAALALGRILRKHKEEFDLWHPAECLGETGAAVGINMIALADAASRRAFSPGPKVLIHLGNDTGQRTAAVFEYGVQ
jgi:3-oxoacyl-[acyl-carrier-protein] synthase I